MPSDIITGAKSPNLSTSTGTTTDDNNTVAATTTVVKEDTDGDGWSDAVETYFGTNINDASDYPDVPPDLPDGNPLTPGTDGQGNELPPGAVGCDLDSGSYENYLKEIERLESLIAQYLPYVEHSTIIALYVEELRKHIQNFRDGIGLGKKVGGGCYPEYVYSNIPTQNELADEIKKAVDASDVDNTNDTKPVNNNSTSQDNTTDEKTDDANSDYNPTGDGGYNPSYPTVINPSRVRGGVTTPRLSGGANIPTPSLPSTGTGVRIGITPTGANIPTPSLPSTGTGVRIGAGSTYTSSDTDINIGGYTSPGLYIDPGDNTGGRYRGGNRKPIEDTPETRPEDPIESKNPKDKRVPKGKPVDSIYKDNKPPARTQLVTSIEFKPLIDGEDTRSPLEVNILENPFGVTQAGMLLEVQTQLKEMTKTNVKELLDGFINGNQGEGQFEFLFDTLSGAYIASGKTLFAAESKPENITAVLENIGYYIDLVRVAAGANYASILESYKNSEQSKAFLAALVYYFLSYVFSQKLTFILSQGNNTQQVLESEDGTTNTNLIQEAFENSPSTSADPVASLESTLDYDMNPVDYDALLIQKGVVVEELSPSQNMLRVHRAIFLSGLGIDPKTSTNPSDPFQQSKFLRSGIIDQNPLLFLERTQLGMCRDDKVPYNLIFPYEFQKSVMSTGSRLLPTAIDANIDSNLRVSDGLSKGLIYKTNIRKAKGPGRDSYYDAMKQMRSPAGGLKLAANLFNLSMGDKAVAASLERLATSNEIPATGQSSGKYSIAKLAATYSPSVQGYAGQALVFFIETAFNRGSGQNILGASQLSFTQQHTHYTHVAGANQTGGNESYGPRTAGIQSSENKIGAHPNKMIIGRPVSGICFDTNYPNIANTNIIISDSDYSYTSISIFDSVSNLPLKSSFANTWSKNDLHAGGDTNPASDFIKAPFKLSSDYANELIIAEDGTFGYIKMAEALATYNRSIIEGSINIFNGGETTGLLSTLQGTVNYTQQNQLSFKKRKDIILNFFNDISSILMKAASVNSENRINHRKAYVGLINSILINMMNLIAFKGSGFDNEDFMSKLSYIMLSSCALRQSKFEKNEDPNAVVANSNSDETADESLENFSAAFSHNSQWTKVDSPEDILVEDSTTLVERPDNKGYATKFLRSTNVYSRLLAMYINNLPGVVKTLKSPTAAVLDDYDDLQDAYKDYLLTQDYSPEDGEGNITGGSNYKFYGGITETPTNAPPVNEAVRHRDHNNKERYSNNTSSKNKSLNYYLQGETDAMYIGIQRSYHHPLAHENYIAIDKEAPQSSNSDLIKQILNIGPSSKNKAKICAELHGLNQNTLMAGHICNAITGIKERQLIENEDVAHTGADDSNKALSADTGASGPKFIAAGQAGDENDDGLYVEEGELFIDLLRRYMFNHANVDVGGDYPINRTSGLDDDTGNFFGSTFGGESTEDLDFEGLGLGTNVMTNFFAFFGIMYQVLKEIPVAIDLYHGNWKSNATYYPNAGSSTTSGQGFGSNYGLEAGASYNLDGEGTLRSLSPSYDAGHFAAAAYALRGDESIPEDAPFRTIWKNWYQEQTGAELQDISLPADYQTVFDNVKQKRDQILSEIEDNHNLFIACLKWLQASGKKVEEIVSGDSATSVGNIMSEDLADFIEDNRDVYTHEPSEIGKCIMDDQQIVNMFANSYRLLTASNAYKFLPAGKELNPNLLARMVRCLTMKGKGFRGEEESMSNSKHNISNRLIMSVGLPCGLIKAKKGAVTPNDGNIFKSVVSLLVTRVNLLNESDVAYIPKLFVFDTRKFVLDNSTLTDGANLGTLPSFNADALYAMGDQDFLDHSLLYDIDRDTENDNLQAEYMNGYAIHDLAQQIEASGNTLRSKYLKDIYVNHLIDYYLKMYTKVMTGIDTDEDVFMSSHGTNSAAIKDIALNQGTDLGDAEDIFNQHFFVPMQEALDAIGVNTSNLYELNRLTSLAARSIFFTQQKYLHRTVYPKKFDRVFSFLIDEGDFIPISKKDIINQGQTGANLQDSIAALLNSQLIDNLEGGDMHTLGKDIEVFHTAGVTGVFDEDAHFSDETMYQYYFSVLSIDDSFDFQTYRKSQNTEVSSDASGITPTNPKIAGAIQLFGEDPQSNNNASMRGSSSGRLTGEATQSTTVMTNRTITNPSYRS